MNGVINIYKEKGCSSFHAVYVLRKLSGEKKVGHTGTLDPDVTGVLPVCIGKATKLVGQLTDTDKTYRCTMLFGKTTDTQDLSGNVLTEMTREEMLQLLTEEKIKEAILSFKGEIQQIPPMYSALKVNGVKLVDAARRGMEIERKSRTVIIREITDLSIDMSELTAEFTVECSKGTYIRTLCQDIGSRLSVPACMKELERTRAAGMDLTTAITLDEAAAFAKDGTLAEHLIPTDFFFSEYQSLTVNTDSVDKLICGNYLFDENIDSGSSEDLRSADDGQTFRIYDEAGIFYALYRYDKRMGCIKCVKMFRDRDN